MRLEISSLDSREGGIGDMKESGTWFHVTLRDNISGPEGLVPLVGEVCVRTHLVD